MAISENVNQAQKNCHTNYYQIFPLLLPRLEILFALQLTFSLGNQQTYQD